MEFESCPLFDIKGTLNLKCLSLIYTHLLRIRMRFSCILSSNLACKIFQALPSMCSHNSHCNLRNIFSVLELMLWILIGTVFLKVLSIF